MTTLLGHIAPTTADLAVHGPAVMLTVLRAEFAIEHQDQPEYAEWADGSVLAVVRNPVTDVHANVLAEPGDLILARRDACRSAVATLPPHDVAWLPRAYTFARLIHGDADDVISGPT